MGTIASGTATRGRCLAVTDLKRALDADRLIGEMYADADLRDDLLAVGLAIARMMREGRKRRSLRAIAEMIGWNSGGHPNWMRVMYVLAGDRPRYQPPTGEQICRAPMIRREGTCNRPGGTTVMLRDPDTGAMGYLAACSRHVGWAHARRRQTWEAWERNGSPDPPANTGGVLARHINLDWPTVYRWVDRDWEMPSSGPPEPTPPRPKFTVLIGDGEGGEVTRDLAPVET